MNGNLFLTPKEIYDALLAIGKKKATAPVFELFMFGILAGMYIAIGAAAAVIVTSGGTLDFGLAKFLAGSVFSVGLMLVLIPGAELFTGNILMTTGMIDKRYSFYKLLRNWFVVYFGNFIGSMFLAWLFTGSGFMGDLTSLTGIGVNAVKISDTKLALAFFPAFFRGILCNMLVCLAVLMSISSKTIEGKILGIYFPIMVFVACGYEHSIANMFFLPLGLLAKGEFFSNFFVIFNNLIPVTLGNIVGGLLVIFLHPKEDEKFAYMISPKKKD